VISAEDRWRLILGTEREKLPEGQALRAGVALDELYGEGQGEGANSRIGGSPPGGLSTREWSHELESLFGRRVRDQVLGRAVGRGRADVLLELSPETVVPSVELLQQLLALRGGLAPHRLARLRTLVGAVVAQLVRALSTQLRPSLHGTVIGRPTRRAGGPLDLRRTVAGNLRTVRFRDDGTPWLVPERLVFKSRARRSLDWRIILVVDVSGSMEASVVYSALMAAILAGLPAVTVHFVAFSTHVVDLSDKVSDPLSLLLEVQVGGGTDIARALRYARGLIQVPWRTLLLLVTDFEEGGPLPALLAEVRALGESGVRGLGLAALDDQGAPRYAKSIAEAVVAAGMPIAGLTPNELAAWIAEQVR
jgi:Mg-chelatase subunit ChlD